MCLQCIHTFGVVSGLSVQLKITRRLTPVQKWMGSLPRLLAELSNTSGAKGSRTTEVKVTEMALRLMKLIGSRGHMIYLNALQEHSAHVLGELVGC